MDTNDSETLSTAVTAVLRAERAASRITFDELAERSGMDRRTAMRMLNEQRVMRFDQFVALCGGLGMSPVAVLKAAEARIDASR